MKILITSYYELRESILYASESFKQYNIDVIGYPLFKHSRDATDKKDNYVDHFLEVIQDTKPDVILWWYINIPSDDMNYIVNQSKECKNIFYNWDDPNNLVDCDLQGKSVNFDAVFTCCKESIELYLEWGAKKAIYNLPGYNPDIHHMIVKDDPKDIDFYDCDISISCTNLYEHGFPEQYINRKLLIDTIYKNQSEYEYKFHIYGPEFLKNMYPLSYKGFINYNDTNKIFNYSKINICSHTYATKEAYFNERTVLILGSGGLLFIDPIKGCEVLLNEEQCVFMNKDVETIPKQIKTILDNYDDYFVKRYNGSLLSKNYTWNKWAEVIYNEFLSEL
jgi:hypothetical protein